MRPRRTLVLAAGVALVGLLIVGVAAALPKKYSPYHKLDIITRVLTYIENNYVEEVSQEELVYGAVKGMVRALDPHSGFLTPEEYKDIKVETQGEFGGIGVEVEFRDGRLMVIAPVHGSPAEKAGLRAGDAIVAIEGNSTANMSLDDAIHRMRGKPGTRVRITVERAEWPRGREIEIVRDVIRTVAVTSQMLEPGYGYIAIKQFNEKVTKQTEEQLVGLERQAGGKLRGLILDLRNNPGGLFDQAVRVADLFLESGIIVKTVGRYGKVLDEERARPRGTHSGFPMIVLVNAGSASASEIVAGALQDHGRAVIVGTRAFGKGSVQTLIEFPQDGSALKLTIARYYTPKGRSIQERGIQPDVVVEPMVPEKRGSSEKTERDLQRHLRGEERGEERPQPKIDDFQLKTALDLLRSWQMFRAQVR